MSAANNIAPSPKQLAVLTEIARLAHFRGFAPSFSELADFLGLEGKPASKNWVTDVLVALERKGLITRYPSVARSVVLTEQGKRWCPVFDQANNDGPMGAA